MIHKRIIGILWIVIGALIVSLVMLNTGKIQHPVLGIAISLTFLTAGFALLANFRYTSWICLPCAALSLFAFPVGTAVGIYYLWYFFRIERKEAASGT